MLSKLFEALTTIVTGVTGLMADSIESFTQILYVEETGFTFIGSLALISLGVGFAYFGWKVIRKLLNR